MHESAASSSKEKGALRSCSEWKVFIRSKWEGQENNYQKNKNKRKDYFRLGHLSLREQETGFLPGRLPHSCCSENSWTDWFKVTFLERPKTVIKLWFAVLWAWDSTSGLLFICLNRFMNPFRVTAYAYANICVAYICVCGYIYVCVDRGIHIYI